MALLSCSLDTCVCVCVLLPFWFYLEQINDWLIDWSIDNSENVDTDVVVNLAAWTTATLVISASPVWIFAVHNCQLEFDSPTTFVRLCVRVSVNRSVVERLRPQFSTDFHQILLAARKCGSFGANCFWNKPEVDIRFHKWANFDFGSFSGSSIYIFYGSP